MGELFLHLLGNLYSSMNLFFNFAGRVPRAVIAAQ